MQEAIVGMVDRFSLRLIVFMLIVILGLVSSIISAILAAIILVEIINALPVVRKAKVEITVVSCFSIGLGAGLTPLGEPLSTIVVSKLSGAPYDAGFTFLFDRLAIYIIPTIFVLGIVGVILFSRNHSGDQKLECIVERETLREIFVRAGKVYLFIMALVFLGEGFKPLILEYIIMIPSAGLYWINIVSAVLDNATLAAAEISPALSSQQITSALMGLLIAGGMLIPGNIPNIIAACKLNISSSEWAKAGIPLGMALMLVFFVILFVPGWLGLA
jgi:predicted cation transporter